MAKNLQLLNADRPGLRPVFGGASGPPDGFTGMVAPGYVAAGDSRIRTYVDDADLDVLTYGTNWTAATNALYSHGTLHFTTDTGTIVTMAPYYGGGYRIRAYTTPAWGQMQVEDNGTLVHTLNYSAPEEGDHYLRDGSGNPLVFDLPEGVHNLVFRYTSGGYGVMDLLEFVPKPA